MPEMIRGQSGTESIGPGDDTGRTWSASRARPNGRLSGGTPHGFVVKSAEGGVPARLTGRLTGRVAVVTGASRGIGLAIASRLAAEGARVAITARNPAPLAAAVAQLGGADVALGIPGRADDPEHRGNVIEEVTKRFGPVDILINNAGINPAYGPLADVDLGAARKVLEVNVLGTLAWSQQVCRAGMAERGGAIVNVTSVAGLRASPGCAFYGASKAALISLTESLAVELGPRIRVNAVAPAVVKTQFALALYADREEQVAAGYPLARLGVPDDVAGAVAFLVSAEAGWITGQTLVIDGGVTLCGGADAGVYLAPGRARRGGAGESASPQQRVAHGGNEAQSAMLPDLTGRPTR